MKYSTILSDDTCLNISKIVLGTSKFGKNVDEKTAYQLLDIFKEAGGNCVDTARAYVQGNSELIIGRWMKEHKNRSEIILSSKGCHDNNGLKRLNKASLESDLDASLNALQTDYIDIYWIHKDDPNSEVEEIMETLDSAVKNGKIKTFGCSNWKIDRIEKANDYAKKAGIKPFCMSQLQWSLGQTYEECFKQYGVTIMQENDYAWYLKNNFNIFAFGSQAQGFYNKAIQYGFEMLNDELKKNYSSPENLLRLERIKEYTKEHNVPASAVILGYIICNKLPGFAIIGCKNSDQLLDSLKGVDINLSSIDVDKFIYG